jgi:peroxiredoxin
MTVRKSALWAVLSCSALMLSLVATTNTMALEPGAGAKVGAAEKKDEKKQDKKDEKKAGATAKVGEKAPEFTLTDTDGKTVKLADLLADKDTKAVVVEWFNPECPFVVKQYGKTTTMPDTYKAFKDKGVKWVAINSSAKGKEGFGKDLNAKAKNDWKIEYPILLDESGEVGQAYGAKTTPHMFVITKDGKLAYAGAIDDDRSADKAGKKNYVKNALEEILKGSNVTEAETRPYGCSVKYDAKKKG